MRQIIIVNDSSGGNEVSVVCFEGLWNLEMKAMGVRVGY